MFSCKNGINILDGLLSIHISLSFFPQVKLELHKH